VLSSFGMLSCETAVSDLGALLCFGLVLLWSVEWVHGPCLVPKRFRISVL